MIKVSVLYPNHPGSTFDMAYYCDRHIPLVRQLLGAALKAVAVEQGVGAWIRDRRRRISQWDTYPLSRWKPFKQRSDPTR